LDLFSGGNFRTISIFALGVTPYITGVNIFAIDDRGLATVKKRRKKARWGADKNQWTRIYCGARGIQTVRSTGYR